MSDISLGYAVNSNGMDLPTGLVDATITIGAVESPIGYLPLEYLVAGGLGITGIAAVAAIFPAEEEALTIALDMMQHMKKWLPNQAVPF